MTLQNCWEFKRCGRELGGINVSKLGLCPAAIDASSDGLNSGKNGGRTCWAISGTMCDGKVEGTFAQKRVSCVTCDFFQKVIKESSPEISNFNLARR
ncbi:MAG: hypothetical protein HY730_02790 [Candidatus Tectomicrobia bacterium]|uniref:Uncharacterized protein n=1 Tax=Tectimicrobiota bacterium TaxID=2528274 RepID=A0A933GLF3_UNCTE|nr:hypothetical protein [Candidatus Tectomicrobia bacterium]